MLPMIEDHGEFVEDLTNNNKWRMLCRQNKLIKVNLRQNVGVFRFGEHLDARIVGILKQRIVEARKSSKLVKMKKDTK